VTIFFTQKTWPHNTPQLFWYRDHFPHSKNVIGTTPYHTTHFKNIYYVNLLSR
jgi:hypothetical protein